MYVYFLVENMHLSIASSLIKVLPVAYMGPFTMRLIADTSVQNDGKML
jgi:hypothetical protein